MPVLLKRPYLPVWLRGWVLEEGWVVGACGAWPTSPLAA